jgi:hypothetical protein
MKWWEAVRKYGSATILTGITVDSWRRQYLSDLREAERQDRLKAESEATTVEEGMDNEGILKQDQLNKIDAMAGNTQESLLTMKMARSRLNNTLNKLETNKFGPGESKEMVQKDLSYQKTEVEKSETIAENNAKSLYEYIQEIRKSDTFSWVWELMDNYKHFLDTLSLDQKVAIMNLFGYYMIFNLSVSVAFILGANHFIERWNLDTKYPWLTKFLKVRAKVNSVYLKINIFFYFAVLFTYASINLYILFCR